MKTIVCYGDSNTWGADPSPTRGRFPRSVRWTGVLQQLLGDAYYVIEEGLSGRTTVWEDPIEDHRNGKIHLPGTLITHHPINLVIILLGTNDLKTRFALTPYDIASGAGALVDIVQESWTGIDEQAPKVLLIAPPVTTTLTDYADMFAGADEKSAQFGRLYEAVAQERGCAFLNAADVIVSSEWDGIHWEASEHQKLAQALAVLIPVLLQNEPDAEVG